MSQTSTSLSRGYLLDTNAAIARMSGDQTIERFLQTGQGIFFSSIVVGELFFGAEKSSQVERNRATVEAFITGRSILNCNAETARWYGRIQAQLRRKGRPIPQNDIWIAATALQHNLTLLTRDKHFQYVDELTVESW